MSRFAIAFLIVLGAVSGCTSQQMYATGQSYQRNQCERLPDMGERQRCLEKASMSHEEYQRETQSGSR
jgi:hypothetical protein